MIEQKLLFRIEEKKARLDALRPLPSAVLERLRELILTEWIYNSNAIEGSTVTLQETRLILETGLTIGGKSLREHFEVINHRDAIQHVENLVSAQAPITNFQVRQIHRLVLSRIDEENAGQYRQTQVRIAGASFLPPESWVVPNLMKEWESELSVQESRIHPIELAAWAHHKLVAIHPFIDGNGRTARLVMNLILMRAGYPPAIIQRAHRRQYYRVLSQADSGKPGPLDSFVGRAVEQGLSLFLDACQPKPAELPLAELWIPLREAAEGTPYSQEYLSLLARTGRLDAMKRGRDWFTTRMAVSAYQKSVIPKK